MYDFNYHRPKSLADAQAALKGKSEARPMSGGMTLIPTLKQRLAKPSDVVDLGGIKEMNGIPDAIFVIDVGYHKGAITEAAKLGIPVIGVVDTNHSPNGVTYVIPGNDDSSKAITLYARGVADAILEGRSNSVKEIVASAKGGVDEFVEVDQA